VTLAERIAPGGPALAPRRVDARLHFRAHRGRTHLSGQHTPHPFHITRPFHLPGEPAGMATLYLQSSSGGLYGDDHLRLDITAGAGAAAHVTTQASTIVHPARGGETRQETRIESGPGALLEFCPDPLILFAGAALSATLTARVGEGARLILADAALTHDPAGAGTPFESFANTIRIEDGAGEPLLVDRQRVTGNEWRERTGARPCHGTVIAAGLAAEETARAEAALTESVARGDPGPLYAGVTAFAERGIVLARCLAADGATLSAALEAAWAAARTAITGTPPAPRRK
jgi:urease accessory protein